MKQLSGPTNDCKQREDPISKFRATTTSYKKDVENDLVDGRNQEDSLLEEQIVRSIR
jgi:hypothetical protein